MFDNKYSWFLSGCFIYINVEGGSRSAGGVRLLYSPEEIESAAADMIGDFLITKQTGAEGRYSNHNQ